MVSCHAESAAKECGMHPAEELKKQADKGQKQPVKIQEWLCPGVWCRWALGQWRTWFVRMQEPKDYAWSWACTGRRRVEVCFLTLYQCQEAESLQQPREEAFAKAEAVLCYTLNKPLDQNAIQDTVLCEAKEWTSLLKRLATKWEVIEGPVTSDGIKEEILRASRWWDILKRL